MEPGLLSRLEAVQSPEPDFNGLRMAMCVRNGQGISAQTREMPELVFQCRGQAEYRINNRKVLMEPGEILLLGQNALTESAPQNADHLAVRFLIKPELIGDTLRFLGKEPSPLREFILKCLGQETPFGYLHFRVGGVKPVENLMENLIIHFMDNTDSRRAIPMFTLGLLFVHLLDQTDRLVIGIREQQTILQVLQYVEANYANASLTQMAEHFHCDVSWLSREIRRRTGRTFIELVQERRLTQAAWLLRNTRQKVSDIAMAVGYENISYFHRIFARRFGSSPKKYRDQEK